MHNSESRCIQNCEFDNRCVFLHMGYIIYIFVFTILFVHGSGSAPPPGSQDRTILFYSDLMIGYFMDSISKKKTSFLQNPHPIIFEHCSYHHLPGLPKRGIPPIYWKRFPHYKFNDNVFTYGPSAEALDAENPENLSNRLPKSQIDCH